MAVSFKGTARTLPDLEFVAGMRQTRRTMSMYSHFACSASFRRAPVLSRNRMIEQTVLFLSDLITESSFCSISSSK
jgi:hypothetical protein